MKKHGKILSLLLIITLFFSNSSMTSAKSEDKETNNKNSQKNLEERIQDTGYDYAKKNGLVMSEEDFNEYIELMRSSSGEEQQKLKEKYSKYIISAEKILDLNPDLKKEADSVNFFQYTDDVSLETSSTLSTMVASTTSVPPSEYYRLYPEYIYSEQTTYDTRTASNNSILLNTVVNIATLGIKPAPYIAYSVLSGVLN